MNNKNFKAMQSVYCYYFPEVRSLIREVEDKIPDETFLVTAPASEVEPRINSFLVRPLKIPATKDGYIDLDTIHEPIIDRISFAYHPTISNLSLFSHRYPTAGSSEGIFHLLAKLRTGGTNEINVLDGEYEGYGIQARNLGMSVNVWPDLFDPKKAKPGTWFISNPSARDGNVLPDGFIYDLCEAGNEVILDLAYAGTTKPRTFSVSHENIKSVLMSFSKPYGLFRQRVGGFVFAHEEVPSLYGNKWFKDVKRLFQALKIAEEVGPEYLWKNYNHVQRNVVKQINADFDLGMKTSDSFLLSYIRKAEAELLPGSKKNLIQTYRRGQDYRFCLTPYFEEMERGTP